MIIEKKKASKNQKKEPNNICRFNNIWQNKKILIADDDTTTLMLIKEILKQTNIEIINAYNGEQAVKLYKQNKDVSLVLLDYKMPFANGDIATEKIKKIAVDIPVLIQTMDYDNCVKEKCKKAGCNEIIHKPFCKMDLLLLIERWIDKKVGNYDLKFVN